MLGFDGRHRVAAQGQAHGRLIGLGKAHQHVGELRGITRLVMAQLGGDTPYLPRRGVIVIDARVADTQLETVEEVGAEITGLDDSDVDAERLEFVM